MHQCLCILEVVARILYHIRRKYAFRLALTCKTLLEPSLDSIWREIDSFQPLIACLPPDLWREEVVPTPDDFGNGATLLHLRRELKAEDLRRYLARYAPRIREFGLTFQTGMKMPSLESLRALELVTEGRLGALSPLLKKFTWYDTWEAEEKLGEDFTKHLSPYLFLFLGGTVENLAAEATVGEPFLHQASIDSALKRLEPTLTELSISREEHINTCFADFELPNMEHLTLTATPPTIFSRLAVLPRLKTLELFFYSHDELPPPPSPPVAAAFPSLCRVVGDSDRTIDAKHFLQHLPPSNILRAFQWYEWAPGSSREEFQMTFDMIKECCNHLALSHVVLWQVTILDKVKSEKVEIEDPGQINLSPLFAFRNMKCSRLNVSHSVLLTPDILAHIPTAWPRLQFLVLCQDFSTSHIPLVNHEHLLQLVHSLPFPCELGTQSDATRIPEIGREVGQVSRLRTLRVGGSPICSPARTVAFLKSNFLYLDELDIDYYVRPDEGRLFVRRWKDVHDQRKASLAET